jgi:hypothetical protein
VLGEELEFKVSTAPFAVAGMGELLPATWHPMINGMITIRVKRV